METQPSHGRPTLQLVPPTSWSQGGGPLAQPSWGGRPARSATRAAPEPEGTLTVTHDDQGALWVLTLAGEADLSTRDVLVRGLANALAMKRGVVAVDVSRLEFCDSWCVDAVLEANGIGGGSTLVLVGGRGMVRRVFDLLDPDETLARHA